MSINIVKIWQLIVYRITFDYNVPQWKYPLNPSKRGNIPQGVCNTNRRAFIKRYFFSKRTLAPISGPVKWAPYRLWPYSHHCVQSPFLSLNHNGHSACRTVTSRLYSWHLTSVRVAKSYDSRFMVEGNGRLESSSPWFSSMFLCSTQIASQSTSKYASL